MDDLVTRAEKYAISAHGRIDQRRKYTNQAYDAHLKAVVDILVQHGQLLQRPVIVRDGKAIIGRPRDRVPEFLG